MLKTYMPLFAIGLMITGAAQAKDLVPASVHDPLHANLTDCHKLEAVWLKASKHQTKISPVIRRNARNAKSFCAIAQYSKGVVLYEQALHELEK